MPTLRSSSRRPRVAIVAGGSRGLGLLVAHRLVHLGFSVAICARGEEGVAYAVERLQRAARGRVQVTGATCDVGDAESVAAWVRGVEDELGGVDVAITVAGAIDVGPAETMTTDDFAHAIDIMLRGPIHVAWAVLPGMRARRRGRIGTVSSIGGAVAVPHLLPYTAAKAGAIAFAEGLAAELAGSGVTSTAVIPGLMRTGAHEVARFRGDARKEAAWFASAASIPVLSMPAARAARVLVDGVLAGRTHVRTPWWTHLATRVHGVAPSTTVRATQLAGLLLPRAGRTPEPATEGRLVPRSALTSALTALGERSARRLGTRVGREQTRHR